MYQYAMWQSRELVCTYLQLTNELPLKEHEYGVKNLQFTQLVKIYKIEN